MALKLEMNNVEIVETVKYNFLGLDFNQYMTWTDHFILISEITKTIYILRKLHFSRKYIKNDLH